MKLFKYREYLFHREPSNSQDRTGLIPDTQICVCLGSMQPKESVSGLFSVTSPLPIEVSDIQLRGQTSCLDDVSKNQQNKSGIMPQPNLASTDSKCLGKESSNHVYHHAQVQELPRKPPKWGISSVQSCLTLRPHELQHARPSCPSPTPRAYSNSCLSSR